MYKPRGSGSIPEVRNLEMNISPDSITRSASETESQLLNVWPIIGQYPCQNCFSSLRAIEDEPRRSSVRLPSDRKPMAHIIRKVPGSIPAENTSTQIHMDLST